MFPQEKNQFRQDEAEAQRGPQTGREERLASMRVGIIASFLGLKVWLNPSWALVAIVPFLGPFPAFGRVALWRLAATVFLHVANGVVAAILGRRYRRNPDNAPRWRRVLTLFQMQVGFSWGLMVWLLWVPGNALNHAVVVLPVVAVLWSNASARTTYWSLYLAGVVPIMVLTMARLMLTSSPEALGLAVLTAVAFGYTVLIAVNVKRETELAVLTSLANQDLTSELRTTRDAALSKRYEAEAANASKTTFLANMSHELRTPLNAILGFSDIIANEAFGPVGSERYRDYAHDINASGRHLLGIINDILDIAKIESGKMVTEPLVISSRKVIDQAVRVVAPHAREKDQQIEVQIAPDADEVFADERALKQILINLAGNASKFTQRGGTITVHGLRTADGGFELIVEDNGPGIDAAQIEKVFTPFNQVDNRYNRQEGGTGLGLSLVRGLVKLHGGRAWIESALGEGVRVHVIFPPASAAPEQADDQGKLSA